MRLVNNLCGSIKKAFWHRSFHTRAFFKFSKSSVACQLGYWPEKDFKSTVCAYIGGVLITVLSSLGKPKQAQRLSKAIAYSTFSVYSKEPTDIDIMTMLYWPRIMLLITIIQIISLSYATQHQEFHCIHDEVYCTKCIAIASQLATW